MVSWMRSAAALCLLLPGLLAGCLGDEDDPEVDERDPSWRVRDVRHESSSHVDCPPAAIPTAAGDCLELSIETKILGCDPPQRVLLDLGYLETDESWSGPGDAYLFCEFVVEWEADLRSAVPATTLRVIVNLDRGTPHDVEDECEADALDGCQVAGQAPGTFTMTRSASTHALTTKISASFRLGPPMPGNPTWGGGVATESLTIMT